MNSKPEVYKGIIIDNPSNVSIQLGKVYYSCQRWLNANSGKSMKDYVDISKPEVYRGVIIDTPGHVSRQLGRLDHYACSKYLHRHPGKTMKDYVDLVKNDYLEKKRKGEI